MTLYQGLIKEKIPRPISHLCQEVGINPKMVWHWIKLYRQDSTDTIRTENSIKAIGRVDSSVVEHQLRAPWTRVQLPVQEPR